MSYLSRLVEEITELEKYKHKYECLVVDHKKTIEELYKYELKEWEEKSWKEKKYEYTMDMCACCRRRDSKCSLPKDICKPHISDSGMNIQYTSCSLFEWR